MQVTSRAIGVLAACLLAATGCAGAADDARGMEHLQAFVTAGALQPGWWSIDIAEGHAWWTGPTGWRAEMGEVTRLSEVEFEVGPDPGCPDGAEGGLYTLTRRAGGIEFGAIRDGCPDREDILTAAVWRPYDLPQQRTDVPEVRPARVVSTVPLDRDPRRLTYTGASLWVNSGTFPEVYRVDPGAGEVVDVVEVAATDEIRGIGSGRGGVWMTDWVAGTVTRVDPTTGEISASIPVGSHPTDALEVDGAVWVTNGHGGSISRIDPETDTVTDTLDLAEPGDAGPQSLVEWRGDVYVTIPKTCEIVRVDPVTGEASDFFSGRLLSRPAATAESLWTIEGGDATWVSRVGPDGAIDLRVDVGEGRRPRAVEATDDAVWVLTIGEEAPGSRVELLRVEARTGEVTRREDVSAWTPMQDVAIDDDGDVWVPTPDGLLRIEGSRT